MNPTKEETSLEDVLTDFATAEGGLEERTGEYRRRFPQFANDIAAFAAELHLMEATPMPSSQAADPASARKRLERFAEMEAEVARETPLQANPFAGLNPKSLREVAERLGANTLFVIRLRDRLVRIEDFTTGLLAEIARALGTRVEIVRGHLAGEPQVAAGRMFKADGKPGGVEKQSLAQALEDSNLSDEQKRRLLSL